MKSDSGMPFDMTRTDAAYIESIRQLFVKAARSGRTLPDLRQIHRDYHRFAKTTRGMSETGAKAWASVQLEETRRLAVALMESKLQSSLIPTRR